MKRIHLILLLAIIASFVSACKEEEDPGPSVVGFWSGTYSGSAPWHVLFRSNGTVRVFDGADTASATKAEGTYSISDSVRATYTFTTMTVASFAGKLNADATSMVGTWGSGTSTGPGLMTLSR